MKRAFTVGDFPYMGSFSPTGNALRVWFIKKNHKLQTKVNWFVSEKSQDWFFSQEIIEAPWFRKKLKMVTPDTVVDALLQIGATTRLFAHEKAIEGMLLVSQEYPEQESKQIF